MVLHEGRDMYIGRRRLGFQGRVRRFPETSTTVGRPSVLPFSGRRGYLVSRVETTHGRPILRDTTTRLQPLFKSFSTFL